jgi:TonB family protein
MRVLAQVLLTFLLNASWQVALVVGFAMVCDWLLRGLGARYRHLLWVTTLVVCLALPVLSCFSFAETPSTLQKSAAKNNIRPTVTSRIMTPGVEQIESQSQGRSRSSQGTGISAPAPAASTISISPGLALSLAVLYGLLLLWRVISLLRAWHRTRTILKNAYQCEFSSAVHAIIHDCQTVIGTTPYRILCSADLPVPSTIGVFKRNIILPQRFVNEVNDDVLRTAIGHELVHIARRDYLTNLICELIYLPLSFHPAAALARRRIKHTRELSCDETVATKLIKPEIYARSLISLIGSAPIWRPLAPDTTIGINESDILEVRIMSLLKNSSFSPRRRKLLLVAAFLLLVLPCVAAARFALSFDTAKPGLLANVEVPQKQEAEQREKQERMIVELLRQASALNEQIQRTPQAQRAEIEARLREVQRNLEEHRRALELYAQRKEELAKVASLFAEDEARIREEKRKFEEEQRLNLKDRKARLISHTEPAYPADARAMKIEGSVLLGFTINHEGIPVTIQVKRSLHPSLDQAAVEAVRTWRFEPAMKNGEPVSMWVEAEVNFNLNYQEQRGEAIRREGRLEIPEQEFRGRMRSEAERRAEEAAQRRNSAELARQAKISMDQAIQIATSKVPGKVLECSLIGEHWVGTGESAKPTQVLYRVMILSGDESNPSRHYVLVNAVDGSILSVEKEERKLRSENPVNDEKNIQGGVLNGKAVSLPAPAYPAIARAGGAEGSVVVRITIDEGGNIIEAKAVSGHPLLQAAAVSAAREAKFTPTRLEGRPVQVRGSLVYNFVRQ